MVWLANEPAAAAEQDAIFGLLDQDIAVGEKEDSLLLTSPPQAPAPSMRSSAPIARLATETG